MPTEIVAGGLRLPPGLHVSFQRYSRPLDEVIVQAPSSLGALPVALAATGEVALPVAPSEAFWVGLEMQAGEPVELALRLETSPGSSIDAVSGAPWNEHRPAWVTVPPHQAIDGIAVASGGFRPFARTRQAAEDGRTAVLDFVTRAGANADGFATTRVILVDYDRFEAMTGRARPSPLDPDAIYQGYLLP